MAYVKHNAVSQVKIKYIIFSAMAYFTRPLSTSQFSQYPTTLQNYSLLSQYTMDKMAVLLESSTAELSLHLISVPSSYVLVLPKLDAPGSARN
ncbi:uncharacterized protein BKA55DRAFT_197634 [Fusarium redolens]|uniref:Uncharacterized protein n=1 Tax=Fusarium redolens TaxID=48865 RepID=A0A9P9FWM9_FUSRE|nr:uncharacterized protein BKA55DRAFT_266526 [Fusarium redolens]XP_046043444.1 uncharacterized protein BKA55DRAFT_197634 [Fusarium redolens]KAH7205484.1 hypothetical protein BKA55DRAFT_266526 [Fusarium redolens]KAH7231335.1 hypothetical protein BKA55DRAFT_197634 [Fusarium redolens]